MFDSLKARIEAGAAAIFKAAPYPGAGGGYASAMWGARWMSGALPASRVDWGAMAGDVWKNSAVAVAIGWARRNFPQASPLVRSLNSDDEILDHSLTRLIYRPNPYYSGRTLWGGTLVSWIGDGNAYWLKVRDRGGAVRELWYLPHFQVTPRLESGRLRYEHWDGRTRTLYDATEIVHLRNGLDPDNVLRGMSDLKHLLREVATDNECTVYDASILRNMGVPGVVISPATGSSIDQEGAETIKARYLEKFTGDNRGMPLITPGPIEITNPAPTPEQMALDKIRRVPEARIAGAIGIPAMVLGLSVGEDQRSYANMKEAREAAAEEFLIPTYTSIADDIDTQLLGVWDERSAAYVPELGDPARERFDFDIADLRMLAQDEVAERTSWGRVFRDGGCTQNEFREKVGLPEIEGGERLYPELLAGADSRDLPADADADGRIEEALLPSSERDGAEKVLPVSLNGRGHE